MTGVNPEHLQEVSVNVEDRNVPIVAKVTEGLKSVRVELQIGAETVRIWAFPHPDCRFDRALFADRVMVALRDATRS